MLPGKEEGMELLTFGVKRRKSSKTETTGKKKVRFSCVRGQLAEISQEKNLAKRN